MKWDIMRILDPDFFFIPEPGSEIQILYPRAKKALDPGSATC
jgi:hypothetical protein